VTDGYRIRAFAELAGVTVKTLRHYDRLELLRPRRTPAGLRVYVTGDLERLRWIMALKHLGVGLRQMRTLLDAGPSTLAAHLQAARASIARQQEELCRLNRILAIAEESVRRSAAGQTPLTHLADVLNMPAETAAMKRYFSDDAWERARTFYESWPRQSWVVLCRDITTALSDGTASTRADEFLQRWNALALSFWAAEPNDLPLSRKLHEGFARAWRDRDNWPPVVKRRFADYQIERVAELIERASRNAPQRAGRSLA
jgi:DNA-binding transcriptional MerR regulator